MANRHFRKIAAAKKKAAEAAKRSPAPGTSFPVYCKAPGCTFTGMSDGFAMECPDCGSSLEIGTPPVGCSEKTPGIPPAPSIEEYCVGRRKREPASEPGKVLDVPPEAARFSAAGAPPPEPETDLPSYPPYSVGAFFSGKDRGRDKLSGPQAIEYARLALEDPKTLGVEIYDKVNNLVAAGSRKSGLRLIRKLGDVEAEPAKAEKPEAPAVPGTRLSKERADGFAGVLVHHFKRIALAAGVGWDPECEAELRADLASFVDEIVRNAVAKRSGQ